MGKSLVSFFSATGNTKNVSKMLAEVLDADIYEIEPKVAYTSADLNWQDKKSRSSIEMDDILSRPEIKKKELDTKKYDNIFLGFPIWWYTAPRIINTFLESYDFDGKRIILFATSGSSPLGKSKDALVNSAKGAKIENGKILNGRITKDDLISWTKGLNL